MASPTTQTGTEPKQRRRTAPRIIPAVPLKFARRPPTVRPLTPEGTARGPLASTDADSLPSVEKSAPVSTACDPPTPQSRASETVNGNPEADERESLTAAPGAITHQDSSPKETDRDQYDTEIPPQKAPVSDEHVDATEPSSLEQVISPASPLKDPQSRILPTAQQVSSHAGRASLDNIVFGSAQETAPAPNTTHTQGQTNGVVPQTFLGHPPGLTGPHFPPPSHSDGSQLVPGKDPLWGTAPVGAAPKGPYVPSFGPHSQPHGNATYQGTPNGRYSPPHATEMSTRSSSHSPRKLPRANLANPAVYGSETSETTYPDWNKPPHTGLKPQELGPPSFQEPLDLATWLMDQVGRPEFADFYLQVRTNDTVLCAVPVHAVVVGRSRPILAAIRNALASAPRLRDGPLTANLFTDNPFVSPESLKEGIKLLYGAPLLAVNSILYQLVPFHPGHGTGVPSNDARTRMSQAISYTATGHVLELYSMLTRGVELVKALLRWDTVDQALSWALTMAPFYADHLLADKSSNRIEHQVAHLLRQDIIEFLAINLPIGFALQVAAPELPNLPRLPTISDQSGHNPRLSQIRFGDAPAEEEQKPDFVTSTLSSVLLSAPLPLVDNTLNHPAVVSRLGWHGVQTLMDAVVGERERRRSRILQAVETRFSGHESDAYPKEVFEGLLWHEHVVASPAHPSGFSVRATRLGNQKSNWNTPA
ncbi:uncharacterized protein EI97DRAFT_444358 [Westerdykella ornata]|uniref:Uncharacterized protein n=1 Tax=Westerdykella ornata TaxID=318751 RepID=A0A6A6JCB6_WESOR|nr:uncharacterized protein EI97DRAFT_444358 [Westerdykella ornata]KAF2274072.1 hypothetical protein EI97DRAFT_444358 [Westerdykella ornata]